MAIGDRISAKRFAGWGGLLLVLGLFGVGSALWGASGDPDGPPGRIVLTYGVGGVLTAEGTLWQYRPDLDRWLTIDEAFREEGKDTHVLPLPVPVDQIQDMATWGFIVTRAGTLWLYEFTTDKWRQIKAPPQR